MSTEKRQKNAIIFSCELCDYKCNKKSDWNRHIERKKHLVNIVNKKNAENAEYKNYKCCDCDKKYKCRSGLWRHKQKCHNVKEENKTIEKFIPHEKDELIDTLIKENSDFKNLVLEVVKSKFFLCFRVKICFSYPLF